MVPNYFSKSQNLFRIICVSKTTKQWSTKQQIDEIAKKMSQISKPLASLRILLQCKSILLL